MLLNMTDRVCVVALVSNERTKLLATYINGLAVASAAIGGISQAVTAASGTASPQILGVIGWIVISLGLHVGAQVILGRLQE